VANPIASLELTFSSLDDLRPFRHPDLIRRKKRYLQGLAFP
jgi:hypothetical protein